MNIIHFKEFTDSFYIDSPVIIIIEPTLISDRDIIFRGIGYNLNGIQLRQFQYIYDCCLIRKEDYFVEGVGGRVIFVGVTLPRLVAHGPNNIKLFVYEIPPKILLIECM